MPLPHRSNREILLHFFLPIGLGIFYIIYETINQGNEWEVGFQDAERAVFLWLRAFFTFILLPFLVIFDVLEYFGVISIHFGTRNGKLKCSAGLSTPF